MACRPSASHQTFHSRRMWPHCSPNNSALIVSEPETIRLLAINRLITHCRAPDWGRSVGKSFSGKSGRSSHHMRKEWEVDDRGRPEITLLCSDANSWTSINLQSGYPRGDRPDQVVAGPSQGS